jgi:hypothetical protein
LSRRRRIVATLVVAAALTGGFAPKAARAADPGPQVGEKIKDSSGAVAGPIEKVVVDAQGRPRQILVRIAGQLRVLPIAALSRSGDAYVSVLSRAELDALPTSQ